MASHKLFALTIFGYKKADMTEEAYHDHMSNVHANYLKGLLAKNDIANYAMQHNSSDVNGPLMKRIYGDSLPTNMIADCDAVIQIVFKDIEDYLRVRDDPHFQNIVNPDHKNFADAAKTKFSVGWFEQHVRNGQVVS